MNNALKNILLGLFVMVAIAGTIFLILFLRPSVGDGDKVLEVRFSNIAGIGIGTRVTLAGRPVGEVKAISRIPNARDGQSDELGRVYFYQLTLAVDSSVNIYNTDEITIQTTGLLGEKSIAIIPRSLKKEQTLQNISHQIIYANSVEPLENALYLISLLAHRVQVAIDDFNSWFVENQDELSVAVQAFADAMKQVDILLEDANKEEIVSSVKQAICGFSSNMQIIQTFLEEMQDKDTIAKFNILIDNFAEASDSINSDGKAILKNVNMITQHLADGSGSLGKLINNDDLYLQVNAALSKANTMMNDINHYGLLFQYDKSWQRMRTKRANALEALSSPQQFKNYFQQEVDMINTSLSRLSILIEKAEKAPNQQEIMQSNTFKKDFYELMKQIEDLSNMIKLYNEQLMDTAGCN